MKKLYAGLLVVLALVACTPTGSGVESSPTPIVVPEGTGTPSPAVSSTPSQEELSAEAERVYRTFFNEWKRLDREGGADEPSQILRDNGDGLYLEAVAQHLRGYKSRGTRYEGPDPKLTVSPAPGTISGDGEGDPRFTLAVCEDYRDGWIVEGDSRRPGVLIRGVVYLAEIDGRLKVVDGDTGGARSCDL